jgi:molecular chaperone DnaK (HSP70)
VTGTPTDSPVVIGIDLGTTNSALAWSEPRRPVRLFEIPQLVSPAEVRPVATLPSFLYFPTESERDAHAVDLPWRAAPEWIAGAFAREHGALLPARQVSSAKSWLANPSVDRTAPLLPWGFDEGTRISPVEASARLLGHIRDAWNHAYGRHELPLERLSVVLTVPASFDNEARELTMTAARDAGLLQVVLIEEPIAALYAWIAAHRRQVVERLANGGVVLVCDVGGGTTDFSLIRATLEGDDLRFERVAIGEHLLLGGDNLDLALAAAVEAKLSGQGPKLTLAQRQTLRRKCSAAKEQLLAPDAPERVQITILGAGRGVVAGGMSAELTRDEAMRALNDGFLPLTRYDDVPARDRRIGLRELGLPYESEPAITKHLAAFLARAERDGVGAARPDVVLFNGGFFTPEAARTRVLDALTSWFGERPALLENDRPEAAVAVGAAFYARLRENPAAARRLLIRAGSARTYYIALQDEGTEQRTTAVCVMPRGTQEGTALSLDRTFLVTTNQPAAFTLYSSTHRHDAANAIVTFSADDDVHRHAPLVTVMRYGKRSRRVPLAVTLKAVFTETGILEIWCESASTDHRWRLAFNLRTSQSDPLETASQTDDMPSDEAIIAADQIETAKRLIQEVFGTTAGRAAGPDAIAADALVGEMENVLGFGKQAWPLGTIRQLADALLECAAGRTRGPALEARWLNLAGFCVRPGFGTLLDAWRVSELRKVYAAGLAFPKEIQGQVEWLILWQRVSAGFTAGQQRELAQRVSGQIGVGQRKPPRINPQIEREAWRLLGSLERLDLGQRVKLGDELTERLRRDPRNRAWLWAAGRFGARVPLYGPLNSVVGPAVAERWIERLLTKSPSPEAVLAVVQIGALTGDPARDISDEARRSAHTRLVDAGVDADVLLPLLHVVPSERLDTTQIFGESLPQGLRLEIG